jgi:hypothetical protein
MYQFGAKVPEKIHRWLEKVQSFVSGALHIEADCLST